MAGTARRAALHGKPSLMLQLPAHLRRDSASTGHWPSHGLETGRGSQPAHVPASKKSAHGVHLRNTHTGADEHRGLRDTQIP